MSLFSNLRSFIALLLAASSVMAQFAHYPDRYLRIGSTVVLTTSFDECESVCLNSAACLAYSARFGYDNVNMRYTVQCYTYGEDYQTASFGSFYHNSMGIKGKTCADSNSYPSFAGSTTPSFCQDSRQGDSSPAYSVYNYHYLNTESTSYADVKSPLECQALCTATASCQAYRAYYFADTPNIVGCTYNHAYDNNPSTIIPTSSLTGLRGMCASFNNKYTTAQQATCYDSPVRVYASARARARRSLPAKAISTCANDETSCPIKKSDGSLGSGYECINLSLEVSSCGSCGYDCAAHMGEGVMFAGCHEGECQAISCKGNYELDVETSTCIASV